MKGMKDVFGKKPSGPMGGLGLGEEDTQLDDFGGDELGEEMEPEGGDLASALASAGYPNVTPDQLAQIEQILGVPGDEGMEDDMGMGLGMEEDGEMGLPPM